MSPRNLNPITFGQHSWNVLHHLPWLFPREVLELRDFITVIRFFYFFVRLLPCASCRQSATQFLKEINLVEQLSIVTPNGTIICTRAKIAQFVWTFHNTVNKKLGKKTFGLTWQDSLKRRDDFYSSLSIVLLCISWVFPEDPQPTDLYNYGTFLGLLIPRILRWQDKVDKKILKYLTAHPIPTAQPLMFDWTFHLCNSFLPIGTLADMEHVKSTLKAFEARNDCTSNPDLDSSLSGTIYQGCN